MDFSGLVVCCVLAPTREREELRFFRIGPTTKSGQGGVKIIQEARPCLCLSLHMPLAVNEEMDILMRTMQLDSALELWLYL